MNRAPSRRRRTVSPTLCVAAFLTAVVSQACAPDRSDTVVGPASHTLALVRVGGQQGPPPSGGTILVPPSQNGYVLEWNAPPSEAILQSLSNQFGLVLVEQESQTGATMTLFTGPSGVNLADVEALIGDPLLDSSVNTPVFLTEGSSLTGGFVVGEWDDEQLLTGGLESLNLAQVHTVAQGTGVKVAVLDTGADLSHPFFAGHLLPVPDGKSLVSGELLDGIDDDQDGATDEAYGHGTHVAGIILQVAPEAVVIPIRVLNADGVGSLWDLLSGLQIAGGMGARVINLSISMYTQSEMVEAKIVKFGSFGGATVAAAGNAGLSAPTYPGTSANTFGVAAVDGFGVLASFSGGGASIQLAAPGVSITSTYPGGLLASASGTSMATAVVSGAIALVRDGLALGPYASGVRLCEMSDGIEPADAVTSGIASPAIVFFGRFDD